MTEKLQKVLAQAGLGSRRQLERWIDDGRVSVNGKQATLGDRVSRDDEIRVDGRPVKLPERNERIRMIVYNKPEGEVATTDDPEGRPTVFAKLPKLRRGRWIMVGRLDINTSGLLLFTDNGELANALMHPSSGVEREYLVRVHGTVDEDMVQRLVEGVLLEDGVARFTSIKAGAGGNTNQWFSVTIAEGRNREVRRLWESQGVEVSRLKRVRYGNIVLPSYVRRGEWLEVPPADVKKTCRQLGLEVKANWSLTPQERQKHQRHVRKLRARGAQKS